MLIEKETMWIYECEWIISDKDERDILLEHRENVGIIRERKRVYDQ